jgi:hypothetical protein
MEQQEGNIQIKKAWFGNFITPQTMLWILAAFVGAVLFWKDSRDNWQKVAQLEKRMETKADAESVRDLDEKVTRQYSVQREQNNQTGKQIEEALDWIEFQKGYMQGQKDKSSK